MIALNQIGMTFGKKLLFYDVNLILNTGKFYALVGANGCGKSTLFKLITKEEESSSGDIMIPNDATIGWLKQDQFKYEETPLLDIVLQGNPVLWNALQTRDSLLELEDWTDAQGLKFAAAEEVVFQQEGYIAHTKVEELLLGLGIPVDYHLKPLKALSGGYKLRVLLAQTLFQNPSILLLDEPTNHLDIVSIKWLEKFLNSEFKGLILFISHDREFIDHLADNILDIDFGDIKKYSGNYDTFLAEKQLFQDQKMMERRSAEDKIAHMQSFVDRFKAKASKAASARSRMKMIEKIEIPDVLNSSRLSPAFSFIPKRSPGKQVCKIEGLCKSFNEKHLFKKFNYIINRNDKIAIVGVNGCGKSTFLKMLLGLIQPDEGSIVWGNEVRVSYFSQDHHDLLNYSCTVLQWLSDVVAGPTEQQIRNVLSRVLFTKDEVNQNILSLSGGESARLLLAKVMLEEPNVLILDEPTNHMDLESIENLAHALENYTGTVIALSHNRYFIEQFSTRTLMFKEHGKIHDIREKYGDFDL